MLKFESNFDIFLKTVISKKKIFQQNHLTIIEPFDSKLSSNNNTFLFEKKYLLLFNTNGNVIFSEPEKGNNQYKDIIINILNIIGKRQNENDKKTNKNICFNLFYIGDKDKIVVMRFGNMDIISCGIFSAQTKSSIIKLYLLNHFVMFLNYLDTDINTSLIIENNINIKIYREFLYLPFHEYFLLLSRQIFQRQTIKLKNIYYKNNYLIELNTNKIIFSFESLYNNIGNKNQIKTHNKELIWNEILYHCHILKNNYMNQYSLNFNEENYENYFAVFELKSTFPRMTFIIKFLPVLNGLALIHEFVQTKLTSNEGNEINHYKEYESFYGYFNEINTISQKTCNSTHSRFLLFKNEPLILKRINNYFVGSLSLKNPLMDLFFWNKHNNIFICEEILNIINSLKKDIIEKQQTKDNLLKNNDNNNYVMKEIEKELYKQFQQEVKQKKDIDFNIYDNKNNIFFFNDEDFFTENNITQKIDFIIPKKFILNTLFNKEKRDLNLSNDLSNLQKDISSLKESSETNKITSLKKGDIKLSNILNDNITENIGTYYYSNINKTSKEKNRIKRNNIDDSLNNILNIDNSSVENNLSNINISIIQNNNENEFNNNDKNNDQEEKKISGIEGESLSSNNELLEGEMINRVKYK